MRFPAFGPGWIATIGSRLKAALCRAHINVADFEVTGFFECQGNLTFDRVRG